MSNMVITAVAEAKKSCERRSFATLSVDPVTGPRASARDAIGRERRDPKRVAASFCCTEENAGRETVATRNAAVPNADAAVMLETVVDIMQSPVVQGGVAI